jgi:hypothetical protein
VKTDVPAEMKFRLLPRKLDNSQWQQDLDVEDGKHISLYYSDKYNDYGLKVKEKSCFEELVSLLNLSTRNELVHLESDSAAKPTAHVIADLMWSKKKPFMPKFLTDDESEHSLIKDDLKDISRRIYVEEIKKEMLTENDAITKSQNIWGKRTIDLIAEEQKTALLVEKIKEKLAEYKTVNERDLHHSHGWSKKNADSTSNMILEDKKVSLLIEEIKKELLAEDKTVNGNYDLWGKRSVVQGTPELFKNVSQRLQDVAL